MERNPYVISFGRIPTHYINRSLIIDTIIEILPGDVAEKMVAITKGYAFAYQALGKYMWDSGQKELSDEVLLLLDEALAEKVYKKIWSELAPKDKWFLQYLVQKDQMSASELLEITKKKHNEWSEPRKRLSEKGIIDTKTRGMISLNLPRLKEFVENQNSFV